MKTPSTKDKILIGKCAFDTDSPLKLDRWATKHGIDTSVYQPTGFQIKVEDTGFDDDNINHRFINLNFFCEKEGGDPSIIYQIGPFTVSMLEVFKELSSIDIIAWTRFNNLTDSSRIEVIQEK